MNLTEALNILRHYQLWRLGEEISMLEPKVITEAINVVIQGAKWQQQRMYSEEEVLKMLLIKHDGLTPEYVLQQFKKQ